MEVFQGVTVELEENSHPFTLKLDSKECVGRQLVIKNPH